MRNFKFLSDYAVTFIRLPIVWPFVFTVVDVGLLELMSFGVVEGNPFAAELVPFFWTWEAIGLVNEG